MTSYMLVTPKRHLPSLLVRKHVVWAIKREHRSNGSTWSQDREKKDRTRQSKSYSGVTFHLLGEKPPLNWYARKFACLWCNYVCKLLNCNFEGLRFYRASIFPFSYWFLRGPHNSAALMRCLWYALCAVYKFNIVESSVSMCISFLIFAGNIYFWSKLFQYVACRILVSDRLSCVWFWAHVKPTHFVS